VRTGLRVAKDAVQVRLHQRLAADAQCALLEHALRLPLCRPAATSSTDVYERITADAHAVATTPALLVDLLWGEPLRALGFLAMLVLTAPWLAAVLLPFIALTAVVARAAAARLEAHQREQRRALVALDAETYEALQAQELIVLGQLGPAIGARVRRLAGAAAAVHLRARRVELARGAALSLIRLAAAGVVCLLAAQTLRHQPGQLGALLSFGAAAAWLQSPLGFFAGSA
jgi:ABC-type bacteriocin/lantibiotic exporter with double-glycine peptidase domain